ncbi:MAG: phosphatidylglycerophosphatase A [bacterium]
MREFIVKLTASGLGTGYAPIFPGTWGTIPGVVIAWLLFGYSWPLQVGLTMAMLAVGVWAASAAEHYYGHDGKKIVIDEVAGIMVAYLWVPVLWQYYLLGFVIFRILDIIKPFPAARWESLPRGWGVMADDFVVGVYTGVVLQILIYFEVWL